MFQNTIISNELSIYKFFKQLNFDLYLTKPQLNHLENISNAMISKGFKGKVSDIAEIAPARHRTNITRFFSSSSWDETLLEKSLRTYILKLIWTRSRESKKPIYFIIDDTISEKTKPSSNEPFFRDCKTYLGLNGYQVRNEKAIKRYLIIMLINYTYCKIYSNDSYHFNTGYKVAKKDLEKSKVIYIYEVATNGTSINEIFKTLKLA